MNILHKYLMSSWLYYIHDESVVSEASGSFLKSPMARVQIEDSMIDDSPYISDTEDDMNAMLVYPLSVPKTIQEYLLSIV